VAKDIVDELKFCHGLHSQVGQPENARLFITAAKEIERLRDVMTFQGQLLASGSAGGGLPQAIGTSLLSAVNK